jgi:CDP-diacylglycerol--glycerol-3-phosphate 3-phosphatidyltransferase
MLDKRWRAEVERGLRPVGAHLRQAGFTANQITATGLIASVFTAWAVATGHFGLAALGLAASGLTDVLDGAVAKSGGTAGPRGAFFDSVADRTSDALVLGGAAWYFAGRDPHLSVLAFAVAALSFLVSYTRSRAESLGLDARGGLMERAERMMLLGIGLLFGVLVPVLWLLAALSAVTVVQRVAKVWRQTGTAVAAGDAPRSWWLSARPAGSDESRLARWAAAGPPGERRLSRWLFTARPPRSERSERPARWWSSSLPTDTGVRGQLRRLRRRTRP